MDPHLQLSPVGGAEMRRPDGPHLGNLLCCWFPDAKQLLGVSCCLFAADMLVIAGITGFCGVKSPGGAPGKCA